MNNNDKAIEKLEHKIKQLDAERDKLKDIINTTQHFLDAALDSSDDLLFYKDTNGIYLGCNHAYAIFFDIEVKKIIGATDYDFCPKKTADFFAEKDKHVVNTRQTLVYEDWGVYPDGEKRLFETSKSPITDKNNNVIGILGVSRDITERKRVEEELRESEDKFRTLLESAPDAYYLYDLKGNFIDGNKAAEIMSGYKRDELIGRNFLQIHLLPARHLPKAAALFAQNALGRSTGPDEFTLLRKDGSEIVIEIQTNPIKIKGREHVIGIARDITKRKEAEQARQESEERYQLLSDATFEAVFISEKGICLNQNKAAEKMFGYTLQEAVGRSGIEWIAKEYRELVKNNMLSGYEGSYQAMALRKDGSTFDAKIQGRIMKYKGSTIRITALHDITEKKKAEKDLKNSEEHFRSLIENAADVISILDNRGRIVYESPSHERVLGYPTGRLIGINSFDLVHPDDIERIQKQFASLLEKPGESEEVNFRFRHMNGSWIHIDGTGTNLLHIESVKGIVINYRDISDRHQLEEQLHQAEKMKAVGQLAGGVAHDFNNLLTVINGYCDLLTAKDLPADVLNSLEQIQKAGERAARLTSQLLTFSRKQLIKPEIIDLNALIKDHNQMLRRLLGEDIVITTTPSPGPGFLNIDPGQMEQIIMNISINARDAMPFGGKLMIETSNIDFDKSISKSKAEILPGPYVMLAISDNGVGMEESIRSRIFEPFFTTKGRGKGTGLGMSTVYGIVKQNNGFIYVYSEPGKGTTFKVYFPRVEKDGKKVKASIADHADLHGTETILLVEDEAGVRDITKSILSEFGYNVITAENGIEALQRFKEHSGSINLLLTDVIMPLMSGRELAEKIRTKQPDLKVLFISGYTDDVIAQHGVLDDDVEFIQKPYSPIALAKKVKEVLNK